MRIQKGGASVNQCEWELQRREGVDANVSRRLNIQHPDVQHTIVEFARFDGALTVREGRLADRWLNRLLLVCVRTTTRLTRSLLHRHDADCYNPAPLDWVTLTKETPNEAVRFDSLAILRVSAAVRSSLAPFTHTHSLTAQA